MQIKSFLLYGAYGYTGELIARYARDYNLTPVLAGRRKEPLMALATKLGLPWKVIDLDNPEQLVAALQDVKVVVHTAGPFHHTAKQMISACLQTGTHYIDINGDIKVFEMLKEYNRAARQADIMLLPGAGFDVVPTDCLTSLLHKILPDATSLKLAFATLGGGLSHGTATTMANKLGEGGFVRKDGKLVTVPLGHKHMTVDFGVKKLFVMTIPWGDIATAHFTTGIPDIETYTHISPKVYTLLRFQFLFNWLLRTSFVRNIIKRKIDKRPPGPADDRRSKAISLVWGQMANAKGKTVTARLQGPEGYTLTAHSSLLIAQKVLQGNFSPGYQTPASAYSEDLVLEIAGVKIEFPVE